MEFAVHAWSLAFTTTYDRPDLFAGFGPHKSVWESRPFPGMIRHGKFMPTLFHYDAMTFVSCTRRLLISCKDACGSRALQYDLIDFARQLLSDQALMISTRLEEHFVHDNINGFEKAKKAILELLGLVGELLSSHPMFCFHSQGDPGESVELDAASIRFRKQLLTMWHESNDGLLADYASQQLGGSLFHQVHKKRWEFLLNSFDSSYYQLEKNFRAIEMNWINNNALPNEDDASCRPLSNVNELVDLLLKVLEFAQRKGKTM